MTNNTIHTPRKHTARCMPQRHLLSHIDRTGIAAGAAVCALGAALAWLAGYDFATRGVNVAVGTVAVLCFALLAAFVFSAD